MLLQLALLVLPAPVAIVFLLLITLQFSGHSRCDNRAVSDEAHAVLEVAVQVLQRSTDHAHLIACKLPALLVERGGRGRGVFVKLLSQEKLVRIFRSDSEIVVLKTARRTQNYWCF